MAKPPASISGFAELTLESHDLDEQCRFYTEVFDLEVLKRDDDRIWLAVGDTARLGLWTPGEKEFGDQGGRHVHYAFAAAPEQLDRIVERARHFGTEVRGPVEHPGGDRSAYVEDTEGNVVEVWDFFERGRNVQDL